MLNKRLVYHTRGLAYVRIQAVGVTNCCIKKGVTTCRIKKWWNTPIIRNSVEMSKIKPLSTISGTDRLMHVTMQDACRDNYFRSHVKKAESCEMARSIRRLHLPPGKCNSWSSCLQGDMDSTT